MRPVESLIKVAVASNGDWALLRAVGRCATRSPGGPGGPAGGGQAARLHAERGVFKPRHTRSLCVSAFVPARRRLGAKMRGRRAPSLCSVKEEWRAAQMAPGASASCPLLTTCFTRSHQKSLPRPCETTASAATALAPPACWAAPHVSRARPAGGQGQPTPGSETARAAVHVTLQSPLLSPGLAIQPVDHARRPTPPVPGGEADSQPVRSSRPHTHRCVPPDTAAS